MAISFLFDQKKMKNALIVSILLATVATGLRAQTGSGRPTVKATVSFSPVLEIKLGSGAVNKNSDGADLVSLSLKTSNDYTKRPGVSLRVNKQLEVFAIGSGYSVNASVKASDERIFQIFRFGLGTTRFFGHNRASKTLTGLYRGGSEGSMALDASYAMDWLDEGNFKVFNELARKGGTYTIDITYTIAAD